MYCTWQIFHAGRVLHDEPSFNVRLFALGAAGAWKICRCGCFLLVLRRCVTRTHIFPLGDSEEWKMQRTWTNDWAGEVKVPRPAAKGSGRTESPRRTASSPPVPASFMETELQKQGSDNTCMIET
jgi:hypothetical protein